MSGTLNMCPQALLHLPVLHVPPEATPKTVASGVVTASQFDEERTLTGTPSGLATNEEGASGSLGVLWSEEASGSAEVPAPTTAAASASSDEADNSQSTLVYQLRPPQHPLTSPTGGASMGNFKSTPTPCSRLIKE